MTEEKDIREVCIYCLNKGGGNKGMIHFIYGQLWVHDECNKKLIDGWTQYFNHPLRPLILHYLKEFNEAGLPNSD